MFKLFSILFLLTFCGKKAERPAGDPVSPNPLLPLYEKILTWSESCELSVVKKDCGDGDSMLWNGFMCSTGHQGACKAVVNSQSQDGKLWRSPMLRGHDPTNSFSRDMALGALLYLASTKNTTLGNAWIKYINDKKYLCDDANDDRCTVSPILFWAFNGVASKIGMDKLDASVIFDDKKVHDGVVGDYLLLVQAKNSPRGYQTHLVGVHLYLKILLGSWSTDLQKTADYLHEKEPQNLFFHYLSRGRAREIMESFLLRFDGNSNPGRSQWCWERADSENACKDSMGWDQLFILDLLLK